MTQVSATAIEAQQRCERYLAGRYWGEAYGWPKPEMGKGAALGDEMHIVGERYLAYGESPDRLTHAGEMFISGLPYLPPAKSGGVEGEFVMNVSGIAYTGKVDYRGPLPNFGCEKDPRDGYRVERAVEDHKSSSNPRKYGLWSKEDATLDRAEATRSAHLRNPQSIIYAARDMIEARKLGGPGPLDRSYLRWLYFWSKGAPKAEPHDAIVTWSEVQDAFGKIVHPSAARIVQLRLSKPDPNSLEPTTTACNDFGGCPYKGRNCKLSEDQSWSSVAKQLESKGDKPMEIDLMDLLAEEENTTGPATQAAPASQPAAAVKPVTTTAADLVNAPEAQKRPTGQSGVRPVTPAPEAGSSLIDLARVLCDEIGQALVRASKRL